MFWLDITPSLSNRWSNKRTDYQTIHFKRDRVIGSYFELKDFQGILLQTKR